MHEQDRYDSLFQYFVEALWAVLDWRIIKAMAMIESSMRPLAVSPSGAQGLLQLMPGTFRDVRAANADIVVSDQPCDVDSNVSAGVLYLREQYEHLAEIQEPGHRIMYALAAYNCGRGYINRAIQLARSDGRDWSQWTIVSQYLLDPRCVVLGRTPRGTETINYVMKVKAEHDRIRYA